MPEQRPAPLMIRGVDPDLWHEVRVEALKRKVTVGALLNEILRGWLESPPGTPKGTKRHGKLQTKRHFHYSTR